MFKKADSNQVFYSQLQTSYKLLPDINSRNIIDSASKLFLIKYQANEEQLPFKSSFKIKLNSLPFAYIDFWVMDKQKNIKYKSPVFVNKKNKLVEQNYLVLQNGSIAYKNTFSKGDNIQVISSQNTGKIITVECFLHDFPIALPPFSLQKVDDLKYKPDSVYQVQLKDTINLLMPEKGFYHLRSDINSFEGLTVYAYEKSFPGVKDIDEMINCTRYIMRKEEYEACKKSSNPKEAIDNFWLTIAGSNERARELLKKYYGRVKDANKRYTSHTQGWKTDRGMIYVIFGEPINTYSSKNDEIWVYGPETDLNALRFVFKKTDNPFSDNDYVLQRSVIYKEPWYTAVDFWRQGKIYIQKN